MVRLGFTRAYGTNLRQIVSTGTNNRFLAFGSGLVVTAVLQSSTATALILTSFAKKGLIALAPALAVMIGADVSTTLVAQILSYDLSWLAPAFLIVGIVAHMMYERGGRRTHIARVFIGLGLMLLALTLIREAAGPLKASPTLPLILTPLEGDPILAIIVAALLTWTIHSSLAAVLLFASLAFNGVIGIELGLLLVIGANIGGAIVPFLATYNDGAVVRRITFGNIMMRLIVAALALPFLSEIPALLSEWSDSAPRMIVNFHTAFNVGLAMLFLPTLTIIAQVCERLFTVEDSKVDKTQPQYLDEKALDSPVIALAAAARETLRIAEIVEDMLTKTMKAFETDDEKLIKKIREADNIVDITYDAIKLYMTRLSQESLDPKEADRYIQILTFSTNLEHIGDIIDKSLMELAEKKNRKQDKFSKEGFEEIQSFHDKVLENFKLAQAIFMSEDPKLAAQLVEEKGAIRAAADDSSERHFKRLADRKSQSMATSALHLDIIRDYRRINSYVTRVAYAILENSEKYKDQRGD